MIFFFKKKPIVLHCATKRTEVLQLAPIQRASKYLPGWWKELPDSVRTPDNLHAITTMKGCVGFKDHYSRGVMLPMWSDLALEIGPLGTNDYRYQFSDLRSEISTHPAYQHNNTFETSKYQHLKFRSPWVFVCEEETEFLFMSPLWSFMFFSTMRLLPGTINFKYQGSNINFMVERLEAQQNIQIPFLEPLVHIVPLSDRPIKLIVSDDPKIIKKGQDISYRSKFINKYNANIRALNFLKGKK